MWVMMEGSFLIWVSQQLQSQNMQANEDKAMLIQSMKKLNAHISNNSKRQLDIFNSLSLPDLQKIVFNLHDNNEHLRKISALLLCQMTFKSDQIKKKIISMLKLYPSEGRICLGGLPQLITKYPTLVKTCINLIKAPIESCQSDKLCWIINLDQKIARIQYLQNRAFNFTAFIDPNRTIFGFTIVPPKRQDSVSPFRDKNTTTTLITPLRMSFNSSPYTKMNDFEKSFKLRQREKHIKTEVNSSSLSSRDKISSMYQERPFRLHTEK